MVRSLHIGAAIGLAVTAVGLGGCVGNRTYGTGEAPQMAILNELGGGIGLVGKKKERIDYQPRAPLVLPPSTQLRDPIQTASASNPQWPNDPDKSRKTAVADDDKLSDQELQYLKRYAYLNKDRQKEEFANRNDKQTHRDLLDQNRKFRAALAEREGNSATERRYLTEPPLEYRAPTGAAAAGTAEVIPPKKKGFFARMFSG